MNTYKVISKQVFSKGEFSIVPIRYQDRFHIMKWRNEQIYHLRQNKPLTLEDQENYFNNVVAKIFEQEQPNQLLFSYLENDKCIGYGGLVHINWIDKNAEISFIMDTVLEKENFSKHWGVFLKLIEEVAFKELKLHKIFTFAFDLRPHLCEPIENAGFIKEATLNQHCFFNNEYKDVIIHSKINTFEKNKINNKVNLYGNILITSLSKKTPLIKNVRNSVVKINSNIKIIGGDIDKNCIGSFFVDEFWEMPKLSELTNIEFIKICKLKNISLVIPTRDGELAYFSKNKLLFKEQGISIMISDERAIENCIDKLKFYSENHLLKDYIIPASQSIDSVNCDRYVVKERYGAGSLSIGINLSKNEAIEHSQILESPIFQPFITGQELSVDAYIDNNRKIKGLIMRKRVLVVNGESQITTTLENSRLENLFTDIINSLNLCGHVILQAIIDNKDQINVIECNPRFGGASTLSINSGLDSFYWAYLESIGINLIDYPFIKAVVPLTQIRFLEDKYI